MLRIASNGALIYGDIAVGDYEMPLDDQHPEDPAERGTLIIDLGWAKAAGLHVIIRDDPAIDHHRRGILLDRG